MRGGRDLAEAGNYLHPMATISAAFALAIQHHRAGRLPAAEQLYRQILAAAPDHAYAHNLGAALNEQGKLDQAIACYRRALQLKPDYAESLNNLGLALRDQGKPDEATACCRRAVELRPDLAEAHNNLGLALSEQGKPEEAAACCRSALEIKPAYVEAHNNLGNALEDQGKLEEAVACYRRGLELRPDYATAHSNLGAVPEGPGAVGRSGCLLPPRGGTQAGPRRTAQQPALRRSFSGPVAMPSRSMKSTAAGICARGALGTVHQSAWQRPFPRSPLEDWLCLARFSRPRRGPQSSAALSGT